MTTNSSNTSSVGSHEKLRFKVQNYQRQQQSNVQGQSAVEGKKVFNTDQVSTSTNSGSQTLQEDDGRNTDH